MLMEAHGTTQDEVFLGVRDILSEALNADAEEIDDETLIGGHLGAVSIDQLDIVFRLERNFRIKIPRGELFTVPPSMTEEQFQAYIEKEGKRPDDLRVKEITKYILNRIDPQPLIVSVKTPGLFDEIE